MWPQHLPSPASAGSRLDGGGPRVVARFPRSGPGYEPTAAGSSGCARGILPRRPGRAREGAAEASGPARSQARGARPPDRGAREAALRDRQLGAYLPRTGSTSWGNSPLRPPSRRPWRGPRAGRGEGRSQDHSRDGRQGHLRGVPPSLQDPRNRRGAAYRGPGEKTGHRSQHRRRGLRGPVRDLLDPGGGKRGGGQGAAATYRDASRFNFDLRTPSGVGAMRAFMEGDFAGSGRPFRLRHAYGQWRRLLIGQTWSTFADPEAEPDGTDFEGLNAISLFRQPRCGTRIAWASARQPGRRHREPESRHHGAQGVSNVPDLMCGSLGARPGRSTRPLGFMTQGRPREGGPAGAAGPWRHARTSRTISWGPGASGSTSAAGSTSPSGSRRGQVTFSASNLGGGIGRYITDLGRLGGQDASTTRSADDRRRCPWPPPGTSAMSMVEQLCDPP